MKRNCIIILCLLVILINSCTGLTDEEKRIIKGLKKDFGYKYKFKVKEEVYLQIYPKDSVEKDDLLDIQTRIKGKYPEVGIVYINVYDSKGKFLYQQLYDDISGQILEGSKEFH